MSINGLYGVQFQTPRGGGYGVVILRDGELLGGDTMMYYRGTYKLDGDNFVGQVATGVHARPAGMTSVFGRDTVNLALRGTIRGDEATLTGTAAETPGVQFSATLKKIA
jgi:hypothetical protein